MKARILVTGGAGYIGSHTCKALAQAGLDPIVYDDLSNGHAAAVCWGPLVRGDVRDTEQLAGVMRDHRVSAVIHFAGLIEVGQSMSQPDRFWDYNVNGAAAVVAAMHAAGVKRLVFSSSAAVYGAPSNSRSLSEADEVRPSSPYGKTKRAAERLIAADCSSSGLEAVALRYFNAAGADPDGELGEAHRPETHLIPLAIESALDSSRCLTVFGDDYATPDGFCVRDYVHVSDLARAHVAALQLNKIVDGFEAINLGRGEGASVLQVIEAVGRSCGRRPTCLVGPRRPGDPPILVANPARARDRLDWRPQINDLQAIIDSAVKWRLAPRFGAD